MVIAKLLLLAYHVIWWQIQQFHGFYGCPCCIFNQLQVYLCVLSIACVYIALITIHIITIKCHLESYLILHTGNGEKSKEVQVDMFMYIPSNNLILCGPCRTHNSIVSLGTEQEASNSHVRFSITIVYSTIYYYNIRGIVY